MTHICGNFTYPLASRFPIPDAALIIQYFQSCFNDELAVTVPDSDHSDKNINNPYGADKPYRSDSPANPYGEGLRLMVMMMAEAFPRKRRFV